MFFKINKLEKLLKNTWQNAGIIVGHVPYDDKSGAYVLIGTSWKLWIRDNRMPKELKAAVIKLCGDLPEIGEAFKAQKAMENQYELDIALENTPQSFHKCDTRLEKSHILWDWYHWKRVLQSEDQKIVLLSEFVFELIDLKAIDRDAGEWEPVGPIMDQKNPHYVYWGNGECIFKAARDYPGSEEEKTFFEYLSGCSVI